LNTASESAIIAKFLGESRATGSPFDLVGAPPGEITAADIVRALESRLAEIDAAPEARTPAADEVRLALHAAAAQLLDPVTRGRLADQWRDRSAGAWNQAPRVAAPVSAAPVAARLALEGDALLAIAMEGGWNGRSLQRLMMFAHARGLTADDVAAAVLRLAQPNRSAGGPAAAPPRAASAEPRAIGPGSLAPKPDAIEPLARPRTFELTPEEIEQQSRARLRTVLAVVGAGSVVVFAVTLGILAALGTPADEETTTPAGASPAPIAANPITTPTKAPPKQPQGTKTSPPAAPPTLASDTAPDAVLKRLAESTERLKADPAAAARTFADTLSVAASTWPAWSDDELAALQNAVVEHVYRSEPGAERLRAAADAITAPARAAASGGSVAVSNVLPALWSTGMLSRLLRERELPAAASGPARLALGSLLGAEADAEQATFEAGVRRGLAALTPKLAAAPDPAAWSAWLKGASRAGLDIPARAALVLAALDAMLTTHADPLSRPGAAESIAVLAGALTWRPEEQSRAWVFRWFDASTVTDPALHALTGSIAGKSAAEGIDPSMVLSAASTPGQRAAMRARYASVWSDVPGGATHELIKAWNAAAEASFAPLETPATEAPIDPALAAFARAVAWSRLSEAAAWISVGDPARVAPLVADPGGEARRAARPTTVAVDPLGGGNDGAWAVLYLSQSTSVQKRLDMLKQAKDAGSLTALECEVVAGDSIRGLPTSVRNAAIEVVRRHRDLPAMLNAVLNLAPLIPATIEYSSMIEDLTAAKLPPPRDGSWRAAARRALVERLLELAVGRGEHGAIDAMAALLGVSWRERVAAFGGADGIAAPTDGPGLLRLAETYRARWEQEAARVAPGAGAPSTLGEIRRRGAGRAAVATSAVQRFVGEQSTVVELMGYVLISEDASRAARVREILDAWTKARREAKHVLEQAAAAEGAMLRLWTLRLASGGAS
jgi:hypothetical protein